MKTSIPHIPSTTAFNAERGDLMVVHTVELQECVCFVCVPSDPKGSIRTLVTVMSCRVRREEPGFLPTGTFMTVHPDVPVTFLEQVEPLALRVRTALDDDQRRAMRMVVVGAEPQVNPRNKGQSERDERKPLPTTI